VPIRLLSVGGNLTLTRSRRWNFPLPLRSASASISARYCSPPNAKRAPSVYGGSALLRVLAAFPIDLPAKAAATPFQPVDVEDVASTIAWLAGDDANDKTADAVVWDLMQPQPVTLGGVIEYFRVSFGTANTRRVTLPAFLLDLGARLGDLASWLGWMPPMRTTAIAELRMDSRPVCSIRSIPPHASNISAVLVAR
jgi:hypothetical protein